jgi:alpha-maltose-1-phosphate synthase
MGDSIYREKFGYSDSDALAKWTLNIKGISPVFLACGCQRAGFAVKIVAVSSDSVSVTLALGEAPYQKTLVSSLLDARMLRRLLRVRPNLNLEVVDAASDNSLRVTKTFPYFRLSTRLLWAIWRRLPGAFRPNISTPVLASSCLADQLLQKWVPSSSIFHVSTGGYLRSMDAAKRLGAITLVENAARHPRHWRQAVEEEGRRFGVDHDTSTHGFTDRLIRRMEHMFRGCDRIIVPSAVARASFAEMGYADKIAVVPTGVDHHTFLPGQPTDVSVFRVCYVGRIEIAKGLGYLLQAWKRLALSNAELVLVGEIKPEMKGMLATYTDSTVRLMGVLPPEKVAECYRSSSVFVLPSANEGLAQVILEAMASGIAVVATDLSGATECITSGKEGVIVPARDLEALTDTIAWCYQQRNEVQVMGKAARARIESQFTLDHYNQRIIALYRALKG